MIEPELFESHAPTLKEEIEDLFCEQSETEEIESIINENIVAGIYENESNRSER